jgi:glutamyl/glutaminyl-tRNA synthetase
MKIPMSEDDSTTGEGARDFIRDVVRGDLDAGRVETVVTRFPPEPNGYLHIGHAKSMCLNFGVAEEFGGRCHLRFDDTNPTKEAHEYIDGIQEDVRWLGFDWGEHLYFASDNFEQLYGWAEHLIGAGKAYVDDHSADEIRAYRGTLTEPGRDSPYRERRIRCRRAGAARQDRHGVGQHQSARSGAVPYPPRAAPAHRRGLVPLPHLRFRPRSVGRYRGRDTFSLHP